MRAIAVYYYRIHGLNVASDFPLEAAQPVPAFDGGDRDIRVHEGPIDDALTVETDYEREKGRGFFTHYEKNRGWVRSPGQGVFLMQNGDEVIYRLRDGHEPLLIAEALLCLCIPVVMIQRGRVLLHGSGIATAGGAVIVSGQSGSGKSTLAAELLRRDGRFLADDAVAVSVGGERGVTAHPAYPQQKLCGDALNGRDPAGLIRMPESIGEEKYFLRFAGTDRFCDRPQPLTALVVLRVTPAERASITRIEGAQKLKLILANLYKYSAYRQMGLDQDAFRECVGMADRIDVLALDRPAAGMPIDQVADLLFGALEGGGR